MHESYIVDSRIEITWYCVSSLFSEKPVLTNPAFIFRLCVHQHCIRLPNFVSKSGRLLGAMIIHAKSNRGRTMKMTLTYSMNSGNKKTKHSNKFIDKTNKFFISSLFIKKVCFIFLKCRDLAQAQSRGSLQVALGIV
jgi:hypothetical protein